MPIYPRLSPAALRALFNDGSVQALPEGTLLFLRDWRASRRYIVLEGWAMLVWAAEAGKETVIAGRAGRTVGAAEWHPQVPKLPSIEQRELRRMGWQASISKACAGGSAHGC